MLDITPINPCRRLFLFYFNYFIFYRSVPCKFVLSGQWQTYKQTSPNSSELNFIFSVKSKRSCILAIPITILRIRAQTRYYPNFVINTCESQYLEWCRKSAFGPLTCWKKIPTCLIALRPWQKKKKKRRKHDEVSWTELWDVFRFFSFLTNLIFWDRCLVSAFSVLVSLAFIVFAVLCQDSVSVLLLYKTRHTKGIFLSPLMAHSGVLLQVSN